MKTAQVRFTSGCVLEYETPIHLHKNENIIKWVINRVIELKIDDTICSVEVIERGVSE